MFLNERWKEHGSIGTEVAMDLQLAADPAKLVLDALEGFYPPHLCKGDREFEGNIARRSCILLLEQLMKLPPEVKPHVREEALKLAFDWMTKMRVESGHELEVLGFLWLLASFQLAGAFNADDLINFLVFIARHIQTLELFKVNEFPPVPVLKDFLNHSKTEARRLLIKGEKVPKARHEASTKGITDVRAVIKCIEDHNLESEYQPHNLKELKDSIASLEKINASKSLLNSF
ncbi:hypothetical protein V6N13_063653 [Hibiscus sabdariffa]